MTNRRREITKFVRKECRGIEVGPWFNPLTPKRAGYNCLVMDVFDADWLRDHASQDPTITRAQISDIEEVDIVGNSTQIADLIDSRGELGIFDYIISSHNFEHLPNPVEFLSGCGRVLKAGAMLSMAVPDKRTCFDYFRPHSTTADLLSAYLEDRKRPSFTQIFEMNSLSSRYRAGNALLSTFPLGSSTTNVVSLQGVREAFDFWRNHERSGGVTYFDAHCWTFTPSSMEVILLDLHYLGVSPFEVRDVSATRGGEFFIHLQNVGETELSHDEYYARRDVALRRMMKEISAPAGSLIDQVTERFRAFARRFLRA